VIEQTIRQKLPEGFSTFGISAGHGFLPAVGAPIPCRANTNKDSRIVNSFQLMSRSSVIGDEALEVFVHARQPPEIHFQDMKFRTLNPSGVLTESLLKSRADTAKPINAPGWALFKLTASMAKLAAHPTRRGSGQ